MIYIRFELGILPNSNLRSYLKLFFKFMVSAYRWAYHL